MNLKLITLFIIIAFSIPATAATPTYDYLMRKHLEENGPLQKREDFSKDIDKAIEKISKYSTNSEVRAYLKKRTEMTFNNNKKTLIKFIDNIPDQQLEELETKIKNENYYDLKSHKVMNSRELVKSALAYDVATLIKESKAEVDNVNKKKISNTLETIRAELQKR